MADRNKKGGDGKRGSSLALVGAVLYLVSWFVPVVAGQQIFGGLGALGHTLGAKIETTTNLEGPEWLPGWPACKFAWNLLLAEHQPQQDAHQTQKDANKAQQDAEWKQRLAGATCLSNAVMALALLFVLARRRSTALGMLLVLWAGANSSWMWLPGGNPFDWLRAGYFLWFGSFLLVGLGLCGSRRA